MNNKAGLLLNRMDTMLCPVYSCCEWSIGSIETCPLSSVNIERNVVAKHVACLAHRVSLSVTAYTET